MPAVRKVKFSEQVVTNNRLFKRSNFIVKILEAPGVTLEYFNIKRKHALEAASRAAPECTFEIEEFSGSGKFTAHMEDIVSRAVVNGVQRI